MHPIRNNILYCCRVYVLLIPILSWRAGAPAVVWVQYDFPRSTIGRINVTVSMYNKTRTRLPEALFLRFNASASASAGGALLPFSPRMSILGTWVDPSDVLKQGNRKQHGTDRGVRITANTTSSTSSSLTINATDALLTVWGRPASLPLPMGPEGYSTEFSYVLASNPWGVNYPLFSPFVAGDENQAWHFSMFLSGGHACDVVLYVRGDRAAASGI